MAKSLNIDINLSDGYAKHLLDREFDATHDIVGNLGHAQSIFESYVDFDDNLLVDDTHLDALVTLLWRQKYCLPIMEARGGDANNAIAFTRSLSGDGMDGVRQDFDLAKRPGAVRWLDSRCF